jgi:hypothetical protein
MCKIPQKHKFQFTRAQNWSDFLALSRPLTCFLCVAAVVRSSNLDFLDA